MSPRVLLTAVLAAAVPAGAFDFPLTRTQRAQKLVEEGQWAILRGDYWKAIDTCTRALSVRGDWAPAYLCRGEARLFVRDQQAAQDARHAMTLDPKSGEPYRILGIMDYEAGRHEAAIARFGEALAKAKMKPEALPDVYFYRAKSRMSRGDDGGALADIDRGLGLLQGLNGDYADWSFYSLRAELRRRADDKAKADADERKVIDLIGQRMRRRPGEALDLMRRRAESYSLLREYDRAAKDYGDILARASDDPRALLDRAETLSLAGRHREAVRDLDRLLEIDPRHQPGLRLRALERIHLGDHKGAVADLDRYLSADSKDAFALATRGVSRRFLEDYRGALADLDKSQALDPAGRPLWGHKAFVQEMLGDHEAALASSEKALQDDPEDFSAHAARAQAGVFLERCAEVGASLEWLVARSSGSGQYHWLRGECRCSQGDLALGIVDLENAVRLEPSSPLLALRLAHQHRRFLETSQAPPSGPGGLERNLDYLDRARELGPLPPMYRLDRAWTLSGLGRREEALAECDAVLRAEPRNRGALKLRRELRRKASPAKGPRKR